MPAFMSIGKEADEWVDPGDIEGDVTALYHKKWIKITDFSVQMKAEEVLGKWTSAQGSEPRKKQRNQTGTATGRPGAAARSGSGAGTANTTDEDKKKEKKEPENNELAISKPFDVTSLQIFEWAKTSLLYDIQIDCCSTDEDWPYLTLIFIGVSPTESSFEGEPSETLTFTWKRAMMFSWEFDAAGEAQWTDFAEFGEEGDSGTQNAADRGLETFVPSVPTADEGVGPGQGALAAGALLAGALPPVPQETQSHEQERRALSVEDVGDAGFSLESFRGEERISGLFVYDLELRSDKLKIEPGDIVGHDVSFKVADEEGREEDERDPRYLSGVVANFLVGEMASDRLRRYHARIVPKVWRLTQRTDSRVFQDEDVKQIIEKVFDKAGFTDYDIAGVTRTHPKKTFCVQYQETDFAFVSRLMEDAGIFYFFKQEEGDHTMVLCDGPTGYVKVEDALKFAHDVHNEPRVTSWRTHYSFVPGKFDSRDYNFTTPKEPVKAQSSTQLDLPDIKKAEIFEYPGYYEDADQGTTVADRRLQEFEAEHHLVHAVSCYDDLMPGMTIEVEGLPGEDPDATSARYLITAIRHNVEQLPEYGLSIIGYRNVLVCIPEETPFTPPRTTPRPRMYGPQTAVVVGDKETDEDLVDTDKYGRVKVQFHWDRDGKKDTDSSCWMRVAQSLAGGGFGAMALPRIGWEVVVSFLDGDPDRPLVTGVVYNELHMPYHELPAAKHKTVLMTRSFPKGGKDNFNELTFHDEKDKEEIYFHAERDFKRVVEKDDVLEIGEKEDGGQTVTIEGDQTLTINKGNREQSVKKGTDKLTVKGDQTIKIESGNQKVDISSGKCEMKAAQSIEMKVGGNSVKISTSSIVIKVGGSKLTVDNMGITMKGMNVKGEASLSAELKGMMTKVSGDAMLQTKGGITMMQ